jgi:hypothetical protein
VSDKQQDNAIIRGLEKERKGKKKKKDSIGHRKLLSGDG